LAQACKIMDDSGASSSGLVGHVVVSSKPSKRSGGQRRLAANALPRAFYVLNNEHRHIMGCAVLSDAYQTTDEKYGSAHCGSFVALLRPRQVAPSNFAHYGMVHKLKGPFDVSCRLE
jgi:hypothetical protein